MRGIIVKWIDAGTFSALAEATEFVRITEAERGCKIGCIEEAAWEAGIIDDTRLRELAEPLLASGYGTYLLSLLRVKDMAVPGRELPRLISEVGPECAVVDAERSASMPGGSIASDY
jgi:hypothetical protein